MMRSHSAHLGVSEAAAPGGAPTLVAPVAPGPPPLTGPKLLPWVGAGEGAEGAALGVRGCASGVTGRPATGARAAGAWWPGWPPGAGETARPPTAWLCVAKYVVEAGRSADTDRPRD